MKHPRPCASLPRPRSFSDHSPLPVHEHALAQREFAAEASLPWACGLGSRGAATSENPRCASIPRKSGSAQVAARSRDLCLPADVRNACGPLNGQSTHFAMADTSGTRRFQCRISPNALDGLKRCLPSRNHPIPILHRRNSGLHRTERFLGHQWRIEGDTRHRAVPYAATLLVLGSRRT
jgi:hypothetical protein